jgi:Holliday junction resolvase RusA-like endonuclease
MLDNKIYPTIKPDTDNIAKSILDSLNGIAYKDDKQVVKLTVEKRYDEIPSVSVWISEV